MLFQHAFGMEQRTRVVISLNVEVKAAIGLHHLVIPKRELIVDAVPIIVTGWDENRSLGRVVFVEVHRPGKDYIGTVSDINVRIFREHGKAYKDIVPHVPAVLNAGLYRLVRVCILVLFVDVVKDWPAVDPFMRGVFRFQIGVKESITGRVLIVVCLAALPVGQQAGV